jgi:hypothetical protein
MSAYETVINSLYEVKDWGREEALREILLWLEDNFFTGEIEGYYSDVPEHIVQGKFDCKEDMINSFKEQFNIK